MLNRNDITASLKSELYLIDETGNEKLLSKEAPVVCGHTATNTYINSLLGNKNIKIEGYKALKTFCSQHPVFGSTTLSENGQFFFYPDTLISLKLIEEYQRILLMHSFEGREIRTPQLYSWENTPVSKQAETFYDRIYFAGMHNEPARFALPYSGDSGCFSFIKNQQIKEGDLPIKLFEFISAFRGSKTGELKSIERASLFHFFDFHTFSATESNGWQEFILSYHKSHEICRQLEIDYAVEFEIVSAYYPSVRQDIVNLAISMKRPVVVKIISDYKHYWLVKYGFFSESMDRLFNNQFDSISTSTYNLDYLTTEGGKQKFHITHYSMGSVERWFLYFLKKNLLAKKRLPLWLSAYQLRLIPMAAEFNTFASTIADMLSGEGLRVEIDDTTKPLKKKMAVFYKSMTPHVIVVGKKELESERISLDSKKEVYSIPELVSLFKKQLVGKPVYLLPVKKLGSTKLW